MYCYIKVMTFNLNHGIKYFWMCFLSIHSSQRPSLPYTNTNI